MEGLYNAHNDVFYTHAQKKEDVNEKRLHHGKSHFPKSIMVSVAISNLGKTSLYLIQQGVRIDSEYYCDGLRSQLIPEMSKLSAENIIFQHSHTSNHTIGYLNDNVPRHA